MLFLGDPVAFRLPPHRRLPQPRNWFSTASEVWKNICSRLAHFWLERSWALLAILTTQIRPGESIQMIENEKSSNDFFDLEHWKEKGSPQAAVKIQSFNDISEKWIVIFNTFTFAIVQNCKHTFWISYLYNMPFRLHYNFPSKIRCEEHYSSGRPIAMIMITLLIMITAMRSDWCQTGN